MQQHVITSLLAFVSTNIDDIFILMLFFGSRKIKESRIVMGQYLGIGTLVALSFVGSFVGNFLDQRYVGLLGMFPIYLAIKQTIALVRHNKTDEDAEAIVKSTSVFAIAGVTVANGADNIGVYVPLLTTMTYMEQIHMVVIFAAMTYLWCLTGKYLASHPLVARQLDRFGHIVMPVVLFLLGLFILFESNSFSLLTV